MVVGMIVGAIIALFCFMLGYLAGVRKTRNFYEKEIRTADPISFSEEQLSELSTEHEEITECKRASDLFRTSKGLLSYKKFVRE